MKPVLRPSVQIRTSVAALVLMVAPSPSVYAQLSDGTFNNANWNSFVIPNVSALNAQIGFTPNPPPLNPPACVTGQFFFPTNLSNPARQSCTIFPNGSALPAIWAAHIYTPFTYTPATDGPIGSVSFSYDLNPWSQTPTYGLLLVQNGRFYRSVNQFSNPNANVPNDHPGGPAGSPLWKQIAHGNFTAEEFVEVSNRENAFHPDFSCNGGPIQFGYVTATSGGNQWSQSRIDNWRVDILKVGCQCFARTNL